MDVQVFIDALTSNALREGALITIALTLTSRVTATVPVAIARFAQQYEIQHAHMAAASMISTIPAFILMFLGQRFVVSGLTLGAVK